MEFASRVNTADVFENYAKSLIIRDTNAATAALAGIVIIHA
jgi:hypothetical protein